MPLFCIVVGCKSRGSQGNRKYFRIPAIPSNRSERLIKLCKERRQKWIAALRRKDLTDTKIRNARICDRHFLSGCAAKVTDTQNPDWVPSIFMGYETMDVSSIKYERNEPEDSAFTECIMGYVDDNNVSSSPYSPPTTSTPTVHILSASASRETDASVCTQALCCTIYGNDTGTQTDLTMEYIKQMQNVINQQTEDIVTLKQNLNCYNVTEDSFKDDNKTKFYTGLDNFQILMVVFNFIYDDLNETRSSCLSKFQQFIFTLQRLRLNLSIHDLAYRYGINISTARRIFQNCLYILHKKLDRLIKWPEREILRSNMPSVFDETFGKNVAVIIDCLEIKMEKPTHYLSSARVWSNHKVYYTTKFLVATGPQGAVNFISDAWDETASAEEIALNCGLLDNLQPGDVVLSEKGFLNNGEDGLYCMEVQLPFLSNDKKHLVPLEIENKKVSPIRIHVKKVIGSMRQKFQILHSVLPLHLTKSKDLEDAPPLVNQIVTVCYGLINLSPTAAPLD